VDSFIRLACLNMDRGWIYRRKIGVPRRLQKDYTSAQQQRVQSFIFFRLGLVYSVIVQLTIACQLYNQKGQTPFSISSHLHRHLPEMLFTPHMFISPLQIHQIPRLLIQYRFNPMLINKSIHCLKLSPIPHQYPPN